MKFKDVVLSEASTEAKVAALALLLDKELIKLADTVLNVKKLEGPKGEQGIQGPKGEQGDRGFDGTNGKDGADGKDGKDGEEGKQGVGVADAKIDFDGSLVITLTDGTEINAGDVVPLDTAEKIRVIGNGGGTSQSVLDAIDAINAVIATYGTMALQDDTAVDIHGGSIDGTAIGSTTPAAGTFTTLTATGQTSLGGAAGSESFRATSVASSVNWIQAAGNTAGTGPILSATGSDTNVDFLYSAKGTAGSHVFRTNTTTRQFQINHTASAVNYVQVTGAATGGGVTLSSQGSDSTVPINIQPKGVAYVNIGNNSANYWQMIGASSSGTPSLYVWGSDTNVGMNFATKGSGDIRFASNGNGSNVNFRVLHTSSSAVNYGAVAGSATGIAPVFSVAGTDTNISQVFQSKGTGAIDLAAGSRGVNISNGGTVTAITRTTAGSNYTSMPTMTISAPTTAGGVQATATPYMAIQAGPTLGSGGTGYTAGDVLSISGATGTLGTIRVDTVTVGVITTFTLTAGGAMSVVPSATVPVSFTGGTGTGATFNIVYQMSSSGALITNAGSGYVEQPTVSFSGGGGSGAAAYASVGSNPTIKGLAGTVLFATSGGTNFAVSDSSLLNPATYAYATGGSSSAGFGVISSLANAGVTFTSKGTSAIAFYTNGYGSLGLNVAHTASAVNYVQVTGAATGNAPALSAQGSDTSMNFTIAAKGSGSVSLPVNRANYLTLAGTASTGGNTSISAVGSDTNIDLTLTTKGTGLVKSNASYGVTAQNTSIGGFFGSGLGFDQTVTAASSYGRIQPYSLYDGLMYLDSAYSAGGFVFRTTTSLSTQFKVSNTASAVNYVQVTGAATGGHPTISSQGSDANTRLVLNAKGSSSGIDLTMNNARQVFIGTNGSAVNYLQLGGTAAGVAPSVAVQGSDTNIDLALTPKGTGNVRFGTYTANMALTVQGYIEIKDSGGTVRKLAVIA